MSFSRIKSYAKLNLALNIVGKNKFLHKIESIIAFINLYDTILIKKSRFKKHKISFTGKFSKVSPAMWIVAILSAANLAIYS